jgi:hypothetical protein
MAGAQPRTACRSLFRQLEFLPVLCQYILPLMSFIINNQDIFHTKSSIHNISTKNKHHLHSPNAKLSFFLNVLSMLATKFSTFLTPSVTILKSDEAKFKAA